MKFTPHLLSISLCFLIAAGSTGCNHQADTKVPEPPSAEKIAMEQAKPQAPAQLPVRYQNPGYIAPTEKADKELKLQDDQYSVKVGANITSTRGPQPLWDIMKRLANMRGMSVSWASDVDREVKVDVNIRADDDFFKAIDNLLRQVGYFHEVKDNTIIVKFKVTRQYHVSIPNMKGTYASNVGGDFIPTGENVDTGTDTEGTAKITSGENEFDLWKNINENLTMLMDQEKTVKLNSDEPEAATPADNKEQAEKQPKQAAATQRRSNEDPYFFIDRSLGLITVVAPLRLQNIIKHYFDNLNREIYRQVAIEAKIIEVYLQDNSKIGIDWQTVFEGLNVQGVLGFGNPAAAVADGVVAGTIGQVYPQSKYNTAYNGHEAGDHVPFLSKVTLSDVGFNVILNALNEQGDAKVLSNPKLTTMNGHPAVLSVFNNRAYIKQIEVDFDDNDNPTYSVTPGNVSSGVALGVLPSIVDNDTVILHLTPITTDLVNDQIPERVFGQDQSMVVGLPEVNVREMSTMVKVKNGEMLIIGGLIDSVESTGGKFAPIVGDIPVIKYLFGYEEKRMEKRELVILLTPRVL